MTLISPNTPISGLFTTSADSHENTFNINKWYTPVIRNKTEGTRRRGHRGDFFGVLGEMMVTKG